MSASIMVASIGTGAGIWIHEYKNGDLSFVSRDNKIELPFRSDISGLLGLRHTIDSLIADRLRKEHERDKDKE